MIRNIDPSEIQVGDIVRDKLVVARVTGEGHQKLLGECWKVEVLSPPFAKGQQSLMPKDGVAEARRIATCDSCGKPEINHVDDSGSYCEACDEKYRAESLAAVGGEALMRQIAGLEREAREYEKETR